MAIAQTKHFVYLPHVIDAKIEFIAPDIYGSIGEIVGIYGPTLIYNPALRLTTNELRKNGVIVKLTARTESGHSHAIMCSVEKLTAAMAALVGQTIPEQSGANVVTKKIVKISISRKRSRL